MRYLSYAFYSTLLLLLPMPPATASEIDLPDLIVLQVTATKNPSQNNLARVSFTLKSSEVIASDVDGLGLLQETTGNFVVLSKNSLTRISREGQKSVITKDYPGGNWTAFAQHQDGSFIVADQKLGQLFKIDSQGTVSLFAKYANFTVSALVIGLARHKDGFALLRQADDGSLRFFHVGPQGEVKDVNMTGLVSSHGKPCRCIGGSDYAEIGGALIPDGFGGYYFWDGRETQNLYKIDEFGKVSKIRSLRTLGTDAWPLALDRATGYMVTANPTIYSFMPGDETPIEAIKIHPGLFWPKAILFDIHSRSPTSSNPDNHK